MKYTDRMEQNKNKEEAKINMFTNGLNKYYMVYKLNQTIIEHNKKEREYAKIKGSK